MKYLIAKDIQKKVIEIVDKLKLDYIDTKRVICIRSFGSKSNAIARCHGLSKIFQLALNLNAVYVLEFISEKFDKLPEDEKTKVIIHELLHIPKNMGGGFRHHNFVNENRVKFLLRKLKYYENKN